MGRFTRDKPRAPSDGRHRRARSLHTCRTDDSRAIGETAIPRRNRLEARRTLDSTRGVRVAVRRRARAVCRATPRTNDVRHVGRPAGENRARWPNVNRPGGHSVRRAMDVGSPNERHRAAAVATASCARHRPVAPLVTVRAATVRPTGETPSRGSSPLGAFRVRRLALCPVFCVLWIGQRRIMYPVQRSVRPSLVRLRWALDVPCRRTDD